MTRLLRVLLVLGLFLTPALTVTHAAPPAKPAPRGLSDQELERRIQAKLNKSKISVDKFQVKVQGGVAILSGNTNVIQRKGVATRLAHLAGATQVRNEIQISDAARQRAAANLQKAKIKMQ